MNNEHVMCLTANIGLVKMPGKPHKLCKNPLKSMVKSIFLVQRGCAWFFPRLYSDTQSTQSTQMHTNTYHKIIFAFYIALDVGVYSILELKTAFEWVYRVYFSHFFHSLSLSSSPGTTFFRLSNPHPPLYSVFFYIENALGFMSSSAIFVVFAMLYSLYAQLTYIRIALITVISES